MTDTLPTGQERWKHIERLLAVALVFLKLSVLHRTWGAVQGYDWGGWLPVLHWTHWFEPLPSTRSVGISYHPPLSYLLGRVIYTVYPHPVETSQILSTLSLLVAFVAMRALMKRIGWLHTLPGLWVLYGGMSTPLFVWLGIETCYDGLVLAWYTVALASAAALFWPLPVSSRWWRNLGFSTRLALLGLVFACGLMTKVNTLIALGLPFLVILARRGLLALWREASAPIVAAAIGLVIVAPFFHHHYYKVEGSWMPISMEWDRPADLAMARMKRDRDPAGFILNMLRIPTKAMADPQEPELDSFVGVAWLETWKRDSWLGKEAEPALTFSNAYSLGFAWLVPFGTLWFFIRRRHIAKDWQQFGWVLLGLAAVFSTAALTFGWKYPLWDWRIFKAKYLSPALFWFPYATSVMFSDRWFRQPRWPWLHWVEDAAFFALVAFVFINHLLPVY